MKQTRSEVVAQLVEVRRELKETRRQLALSQSEREIELADCLRRVVRPGTGPDAKGGWIQAVEDGKRLLSA